ncbi:MAG TPA: O-antigen ligase family protein [Xanthobacteraceae bacterium]|nr:O-antigen ligase family protein [Xanthobacteraceae bacterium]
MTTATMQTTNVRQNFVQFADWLAVSVAVSLPWSTSATSILLVLWVIAVLPTLSVEALRRELMSPAGGLPALLWLLGALGMLWADVPWHDRFAGLEGFIRLLAIPILFAQFRRSDRGMTALYGYLASATALLLTSFAFALIPPLQTHGNFYGVPVKDYIFQAGEFLMCGFVLLGAAADFRARLPWRTVLILTALAVLFLADNAFVITSRTSLLVVPFLVAALGWRMGGSKGVAAACVVGAIIAPILWFSSPHLRDFTLQSVTDFQRYFASNALTSGGLHFEFIRKSIAIVADAPVFGHGTGSIGAEFQRATAGEVGAAGVVTVNPHNQIFAVAIQIGYLGAAVLTAMWVAHVTLFIRGGWVAWAGLVIVIENIVSSAVNSHLFDFGEGWLYVFGVGVAGGIVKKLRDQLSLSGDSTS